MCTGGMGGGEGIDLKTDWAQTRPLLIQTRADEIPASRQARSQTWRNRSVSLSGAKINLCFEYISARRFM